MSAFRDKANIHSDERWFQSSAGECSEAEYDPGGHTAFGGAMKHLIVGTTADVRF